MYYIHTEAYGFARFFSPSTLFLHLSSAYFHPLLCSSAYELSPWSLGLAAAPVPAPLLLTKLPL